LRLLLGAGADLGVAQPSGSDLQSFGWEIVLATRWVTAHRESPDTDSERGASAAQ
jgi:hypothetical protein